MAETSQRWRSKAHASKPAWKRHLVNLAKKHFPQVNGINLHTADALPNP